MRRALAVFFLLSACQQQVASQLSERSANQAMVFLSRVGIGAQAEGAQAGYSLWVSRAEADTARRLLQESRLPRREVSCSPDSLFPSPQEESEAKRACLSYDLSERLSGLDGVVSAEVLLPLASTSQWPLSEAPISSVSVLYKYQDKPTSEDKIRSVLLASLEGSPQISILAQPLTMPTKEWVSVGPFAVAPMSARPLLLSLLALITFGVGSIFACLSLWLRQRRLQPRPSGEASV
jgi:type III secretory pathway lipoprotein EscJ